MDEDSHEPMSQLSAHLDRGWDLLGRGDLAGAMLSAEKSLELDEESPEAHTLMGYVYQAEGRPDEALEHYRSALDLDEGYVDAMLNAADVLVHPLRQYDEALRLVTEAIDWLEPDEVDELTDALLLKLDIHMHRGEETAARKVARELPDGPFDNPTLLLQVGRARLDVGDLEGAEPLIREAVEAAPSADAYYYAALVEEMKGDMPQALIAFLRARELDVTSAPLPWSLPIDQFQRRVQTALGRLPAERASALEGALVVVTDLPGAEVVADGLDPRVPVLLDHVSEAGAPPSVGRVFVYKRNVERQAAGMLEVEDEILQALDGEIAATFEPPEASGEGSSDGESGHGESGHGESGHGESGDGESGDGESADGESADGETGHGESGDGETGHGENSGGGSVGD